MSDSTGDRDQLIFRGSSLLSEYIRSDESNPDLASHLRVTSHETCTLSGMEQHDYPPLESPEFSLSGLPHISSLRKQAFPPELVQQLDQTQFNCMAGLFPEISRVWLTVDHRVYLWDYSDGSDLAYYDGLQEVILSVSLSLPRPGILREHIRHLLCLTTPSNIVVLGVSFAGRQEGIQAELVLHPEPLFCLPTDGVSLTVVPRYRHSLSGSSRIFFGGKDGCLYEFLYKAKEDWFGGRCKKINHTSSLMSYLLPSFLTFGEDDPLREIAIDTYRHHLYTLSAAGSITLYDMGQEGTGMSRVTSLTHDSISQICCGAALTGDKGLFRPIVSIHPLPPSSSSNLHLLALTKAGVRLYFTSTPNGIIARPSLLALVHVRLPPGFSASSSATRPPRSVTGSHLSPSVFLMNVNTGEGSDSIWIMSQDLFPSQTSLMETRHVLRLPCSVWGICESGTPPPDTSSPRLPVCCTQHLHPNTELLILTSSEVYKLFVLRPMEQLKELLSKLPPEGTQVSSFFKLMGQGQACAMCLHLVADPDQRVAAAAAQAFFRYGGDPKFLSPSQPPLAPQDPSPQQYLGKALLGPDILYSDKLHGLGLFLSRLLRPLWRTPLVQLTPSGLHEPLFQERTLEIIRERLIHLRDFLDSNPSLRNAASPLEALSTNTSLNSSLFKSSLYSHPDSSADPSHQRQLAEAVRFECHQFEALHHITELSIELMSLLILLSQHQLPLLLGTLPSEQRRDLTLMTYADLLPVHRQVTSALLSALLARYHGDERVTEELSQRLLQLTPSLYSAEDAKRAKAEECLSLASDLSGDPSLKAQRESLLAESLQLFMDVSHQVSLPAVCSKYYELRFYAGLVDLCLSAAQRLDPSNRAKSYVDTGKPASDVTGLSCLEKRDACYQTIVDYLERSHAPGRTGERDRETHEALLSRALAAPEELLHHALYSHLIETGQEERLVRIDTAYLEVYLRAAADTAPPGDTSNLNLLWRYYKNTDNFMSAARVLHSMAASVSQELLLSDRIELLSRAVMCATSHPIGFSPASQQQEFIQETRDKLEVAQIQLGIQGALKRLETPSASEAAAQLNQSLLDNTKLYVEFATPFRLSEWRLSILHSSGHQDPRLVESLWRDIVISQFRILGTDRDTIGLLRKLKELTQKYQLAGEAYFPLRFILQQLEQQAFNADMDQSHLFMCLLEAGLSPIRLLSEYHRAYLAREAFWLDNQAQLHFPQVLLKLSSYLMSSHNLLGASGRRQVVEWLSSHVPIYLTDLQGLNATAPLVGQLIGSFRDLIGPRPGDP